MCPKKLHYAAGDDLQLYDTPAEAMEEGRRQMAESLRRKQYRPEETRVPSGSSTASNVQYGLRHSSGHVPTQHNMRYQSSNVPVMDGTSGATASVPTFQAPAHGPIYQHYASTPSTPVRNAKVPPPPRQVISNPNIKDSPHILSSEDMRDNQIAIKLFTNHDIKKKGRLTAEELQNLLQNDDSTHFCISSIDALINMFGASRFGTINQSEFVALYKRVKGWRKVYVDNDINRSYTLSASEFHNSLQELGYLIPFEVTEKLFDQYAEFINQHHNGKELKFDRFVESLVWLMRLTKMFRKYDVDQKGIATIHYKDFIGLTLYLGRFLPH